MNLSQSISRLVRLSMFSIIGLFLAGATCCNVVPTATITEPTNWMARYQASDANLQTDAVTLLSLTVFAQANYDEFRFKVGSDATVNCAQEAGYSAWTAKAQKLQADISAIPDGKMRLCVVARGKNNCGQLLTQPISSASVYRWIKDANGPGPFTITAPQGASNTLTQTVSWQASAEATKYDLKIARQPDCSDVAHEFLGLTATSQAITLAADGTYFSCVTAKDNAGRVATATNNALQFSVDSTPPSTFSFNAPNGTQTSLNVSAAWTAATGATEYKVSMHSANNCTEGSMLWNTTVSGTSTAITVPGDGTFFLCASAKDAAGNSTDVTNQPYSFQVQQPVVVQETIVKNRVGQECWGVETPGSVLVHHLFSVPGAGSTFADELLAASFRGNGEKLSRVGTLIVNTGIDGTPNTANWGQTSFQVLFYSDSSVFVSDPLLEAQTANSPNKRALFLHPSNNDPSKPNYYQQPIGSFAGVNIYYVELDLSSMNIQTTSNAEHLIGLVPSGGNGSAGNFFTFLSKSCAGVGSTEDWYRYSPGRLTNQPPATLTQLGLPFGLGSYFIATKP